jgi:hypothetical protein
MKIASLKLKIGVAQERQELELSMHIAQVILLNETKKWVLRRWNAKFIIEKGLGPVYSSG